MGIQNDLNKALGRHNVEVKFSKNSLSDYKSYPEGTRKIIVALILRQGTKKNSLLKPEGNGQPLQSPLTGFAEIKPKGLNMRIIYRPRKFEGVVRMEIIAIGPRDKDEVYKIAVKRLSRFNEEMDKKKKC